jgi:hypothetical protein
MDRSGEDDSLDAIAECRIGYVFRSNDTGFRNPLETVLHPDGS